MNARSIWFSLVIGLLAAPAGAQIVASRCADCHLAAASPPAPGHLGDWERSPHGRNQVGCEKCHGGDATTFESFRAHQGVLNSRNPASPVHRRNISATCGACHPGPFVAFQKSRHYVVLQERKEENGPSCVTCHDEVAARLLSPKSLERQCKQCHGPGRTAPHGDRAPSGRLMLERITEVRASLTAVRHLLDRVPRGPRRTALEDAYEQAQVPLVQAIHDSHSFVFDSAIERLILARDRAEAVAQALVSQK